MQDDYQIPAIVLIAALMLALWYLHLRFRTVRTLLWFLGITCAEIQALLIWLYSQGTPIVGAIVSPVHSAATAWMTVAGEFALVLSSGLFLASLSPLSNRIGRFRVYYVVPYIVPLLLYSGLYYGVSQHPTGLLFWVYCVLALWAAVAAFLWSSQKGMIPIWLALMIVGIVVGVAIPWFVKGNVYWPLLVVESGNMLMTATLIVFTFRRISPGVVLASLGFLAWALPPIFLMRSGAVIDLLEISLARAFILGKVAVAMGLILLILEDEVAKNQTAQLRERRIRTELAAYARKALSARSLEDFDRECSKLCSMIVEHSRFAKAAMVVRTPSGSFTLVSYSGLDGAAASALDTLAQRLPANCFSPISSSMEITPGIVSTSETARSMLAPDSKSMDFDLSPWLTPGDELERLHLTRVGAIPMLGPDNSPEGALLVAGLRNPEDALRAEDLLPLEILAGRVQSARSQAIMLGRLIQTERFAGVGQLSANLAQQLNNPLTVVLGYATLLEESAGLGADRHGAEAITQEARRMKAILERLSQFSRVSTERFSSFSVHDLINDIEQLHRVDFLRHSIEFRISIAPGLPTVFGNVHHLRQAMMHAMQYAIECVLRVESSQQKAVRIEASLEDDRVQILLGHSGPGFCHPERAFDALSSGFASSESTGIALSLCAAIIREHRGNITAVNYQPTGAAVILDLPVS